MTYNNDQFIDYIYYKEKGQYYYRARITSASQSRFTTQNPAGMQEGPNLYPYVGNIIGTIVPMSVGNPSDFLLNPVNKRDPSGLGNSDNFNLCMMLCSAGGCAALCGSATLSGPIGAAFAVGCAVAYGIFGCGLLYAMVFGDDSGLWPGPGPNSPGCDPQSHQCVR